MPSGYYILVDLHISERAKKLRLRGKTYQEINRELGTFIPKSTFSYWFRNIILSPGSAERIAAISSSNLKRGRKIALANKLKAREVRAKNIHIVNQPLYKLFFKDSSVRKIALAILYLAEGSKTNRASIMFGNSNPSTVKLFVSLLRSCFDIDESKFRATVQCRADQDANELQKFWSKITGIPTKQFYNARVDKRSIGKPTKKLNYKGVCRIDYFSANIDFELKNLATEIEKIQIS